MSVYRTIGPLVLLSERQGVFEKRCIDVSHGVKLPFVHSMKDQHIQAVYIYNYGLQTVLLILNHLIKIQMYHLCNVPFVW